MRAVQSPLYRWWEYNKYCVPRTVGNPEGRALVVQEADEELQRIQDIKAQVSCRFSVATSLHCTTTFGTISSLFIPNITAVTYACITVFSIASCITVYICIFIGACELNK